QKCIKTAELSVVREFDAVNIVSCRIKLLSFFDDLIRRDENELGFGIDESGDQPWTCHAIYFRAFTSNPTHSFFEGDQLPTSEAEPVLLVVRSQRLSIDGCFDPLG